ncbi:MAG: trigger factor [Candidatus Omnitrophota bacterium]
MKILEQQDSGTCAKTLKIELPREEVTGELDEVYKEFIDNAAVPGFRKGKAPRHIVKMRYGKHLDKEAMTKAIENAVKKAAEELQLDPVTQPDLGDFDHETKDDPIVFEAKFEYRPNVDVGDYKTIRPTPPPSEVSEEDIAKALNQLREKNAMYASIDDRPAAENDFLNISCSATIDENPFLEATHSDITIELGSKRYIPGFEDALIGLNVNDEKGFSLTLPDDYPTEDKRGKEAKFLVKVKQIREKKMPELDDEFAKDMGAFGTLAELKERIAADLKQNLENRKQENIMESLRRELLERNVFDVPPSLVRGQYNYINAVQDMEYRRIGSSLEIAAKEDKGLLARNEKAAEEEVRISIILEKIAKKESIEIDDKDYDVYIARLARSSHTDPYAYKERIESRGLESYYRRLALEEKTLEYLKHLSESGDTESGSFESTESETAEETNGEAKAEE